MKLNFCTLFNSGYLARGIALYESLLNVCPDFHLYVFAFDDASYNYLKSQSFEKLTVISLKEFEDTELLRVKPTRTAGEYCWTCTSSTILYCIEKFSLENCTYVDADMYFYINPSILVEEMKEKSVLITEHRYTKMYDQTERSGKYCVQFITIKNTTEGLEILRWWRNACIDWCYARHEDGKFGDQKYLDDWMTRFTSVHELQHLGGGIAPWNVQQYQFASRNGNIVGKDMQSSANFEAVFFHYHGLKIFKDNVVRITEHGYEIDDIVKQLFFFPYIKRLVAIDTEIKASGCNINSNGAIENSPYPVSKLKAAFRYYNHLIKSSKRNILGAKLLKNLRLHYYYDINKL